MPWKHGRPLEGKSAAILGQGPSLSEQEVEEVQAAGIPIIAIKDSSRYVVDPFLIYACDRKWWVRRWADERYGYLRETKAIKVTMGRQLIKDNIPGLLTVHDDGMFGLSFKEGYVRHGRNSGAQVINLTINLGSPRILLLGFDMQRVDGKSHFFPEHVATSNHIFKEFANTFNLMKEDLNRWNGEIFNTCLTSALSIFPKMPLQEAIERAKAPYDR